MKPMTKLILCLVGMAMFVFIPLLTMKLMGVINWDWWYILLPIIAPTIFVGLIYLVYVILIGFNAIKR